MAIERVVVCDSCKKSEQPARSWGMPHGWRTIEVEGEGTGETKVSLHGCSRECAGKLLRIYADELDPPKVEIPPSGHPFR